MCVCRGAMQSIFHPGRGVPGKVVCVSRAMQSILQPILPPTPEEKGEEERIGTQPAGAGPTT